MAVVEAGLLLALVDVDLAGVPGPARAAHAGEALPQPVQALTAIRTPRLLAASRLIQALPNTAISSAANRLIGEVVQSRRRPLLGPSPG